MKTITGSQIKILSIVSIVISLFLSVTINSKTKCSETIKIDDKEYKISERWCGKKLKTSDLVDITALVKLADELTFEDSRIYVTKPAADALIKMQQAAKKDSVELIVDSGFRSVWYQRQIISRRLNQGEEWEKIIGFVAPPGYSEHHTGRAVDFVPSEARFAHTKVYRWLKANAAKYNFYETFPEDDTGLVPWESWHWVYNPQ